MKSIVCASSPKCVYSADMGSVRRLRPLYVAGLRSS
jgi:hypothetical protein